MKAISLTKPGIIFGNVITCLGGFFLASSFPFNVLLLLATLVGMSLVIACGCVLNNIIDQDIDRVMERTKNRVMAQKLMSNLAALLWAVLLGALGFIDLYLFTNTLTTFISFIGLVVYVGLYSLWFKRHSGLGTFVGGIAGAVPPVVGYCAVTNQFDLGAVLLFAILFFWQLPHFYAISIYRLEDFTAASIPILPNTRGLKYTQYSMMVFIVLFTIVAVLPTVFGYAGLVYFVVALASGLIWLWRGLSGLKKALPVRQWAKKMFLVSVLIITVLSLVMVVKV